MMMGGSDPCVGVNNLNSHGIDYSSFALGGQTITGLKINWKEEGITAIELAYNGKACGPVAGSANPGSQEEIFALEQGDAVLEVFGRFSNFLNCLGIKTIKGKTKVWGNPLVGNTFHFKSEGLYIKAIKAKASAGVDYLEPVYGDKLFIGAQPWAFSNNGKFTVDLRGRVGGDDEFTDWDWVESKFNYLVNKVSLWHDNQTVKGIQFHYELDGTIKSPGQHVADQNSNTVKEVLVLEADEYLEKALIKITNEWVTFFLLVTNKGRTIGGGNRNVGQTYLAVVPQGHRIVALNGHFGSSIRQLGVHFDEI